MRFREFKIIKEAKNDDFYTVGDSHARGVGTASGLDDAHNLAVNGAATTGPASTTREMWSNIPKIPKGASVLICVGANDTANVVRANKDTQGRVKLPPASKIVGDVMKVVEAVRAQGVANIVFMLFPSGDNKKTQYYAGDFQGEVRDALRSAVGVKVIDYDGSPLQKDGVHYQFGVYKQAGDEARKIFGSTAKLGPSDAKPGAPRTKEKSKDKGGQAASPTAFTVDVPTGRVGTAIADIQKALIALGYPLPRHGVDGIRGPETSDAVRKFQQDNNLTVDGDPGPETVGKLNSILKSKPNVAGKLTNSTPAEVKSKVANREIGNYQGDASQGIGETGNAKEAVEYFISKGWTPAQAAGIVGNLQAESGANLRTNSVGDGGQAYGIAQWHPDRQAKFAKAFGKNIRESSFKEQLAFVQWELEHDERNAASYLKKAKTPEEAAWYFDEYYERSSGAHRQKRINNAVALAGKQTTVA